MALKITVDKPEFNLRETLTRLDTERIPYEKMPVGSVIQVQKHQLVGSGQVNTTSSSYQDSGLFIDFHPKFANSRLLVTCEFNAQSGNQSNSGIIWTVFREIDGTATSSSVNTFSASSPRTITYHSPAGYIHEGTSLTIEDKPKTIKKVQYRLFFHSHNGSASVGVAKDWGGAHFTVMEVRE
tara:strand:- start:37 stop:582 length:546 start_codon:yes stop_codon:yes gene_type:complete